jgi:hypothetical protein
MPVHIVYRGGQILSLCPHKPDAGVNRQALYQRSKFSQIGLDNFGVFTVDLPEPSKA